MRREHAATGGGRPSEYSPSSSRSTPSPQSIPSLFISWSAIDRRRIDRLWTLLQVQGRRESTEEGLQVRKPEAEGLGGCIRSCEAVPLWSCQEPSRERPSPHYPVDIFHRYWSHHSAQPFSPPRNLVDVLHQYRSHHSVLHRRTLNGQWNLFNSLWLLMLQFIRRLAAWLFKGNSILWEHCYCYYQYQLNFIQSGHNHRHSSSEEDCQFYMYKARNKPQWHTKATVTGVERVWWEDNSNTSTHLFF